MSCCSCLGFLLLTVTLLACATSFAAPYWTCNTGGVINLITGSTVTRGLIGMCTNHKNCRWIYENDFAMIRDDSTFAGNNVIYVMLYLLSLEFLFFPSKFFPFWTISYKSPSVYFDIEFHVKYRLLRSSFHPKTFLYLMTIEAYQIEMISIFFNTYSYLFSLNLLLTLSKYTVIHIPRL